MDADAKARSRFWELVAAIAVVVNYAAGRGDSVQGIKLSDINAVSREALTRVHKILDCLVTLNGG